VVVRAGRAEELWISDSRFENITGPAVVIGDEKNARSQTNLHDVVCENVPVVASFRESGRRIAGKSGIYEVRDFCHGLQIPASTSSPEVATTFDPADLENEPPPVPSDIPDLPPQDEWVNVLDLGAKGDGVTDVTGILKEAVAKHRTLYFPTGRYRVTETIALRPDTVLIGLNPITTQLVLADNTAAFSGGGAPAAVILAPKGGTTILTGLGLDTGINNRAIAVKWMAGGHSMMNDVRFLGGHGTFLPNGMRRPVYNNNRTGDADPRRPWDSQPHSLWVTDGGGGTFKDIWSPNPYAQSGICISDTSTPGRIYAMSLEHHVRNEMKIRNVSNWKIYALQTEEERGEGPNALPVSIEDSHDIAFANLFLYRVESDAPYRNGVTLKSSHDITFRGVHAYSPGKFTFDNTVFDETSGIEFREREIALLKITEPKSRHTPDPRVEKCAGGFNNIDGATADADGNIYFVDARWNRIHRWSPKDRDLTIIRDTPIAPTALAFDTRGNLLVVTRDGKAYAFKPGGKEDDLIALEPTPAVARLDGIPMIALNRWRDEHDFLDYTMERKPWQFVAPDGVTCIPAGEDFVHTGKTQRRALVDLFRAYALAPARTGVPFYVADEFGHKTWEFSVDPDGALSQPKLFAEEGEAGVAVDPDGNVYVAAGQIHVYDPAGKKIETIEVPERPTSLVFGGADRRTLFVTARSSLYEVHPAVKAAR
jgi:sugar lactone lactonase YvrE